MTDLPTENPLAPSNHSLPRMTPSSTATKRAPRFKPTRQTTISKALSFVLRHGAVKEGITLDNSGFARLSDLLAWRKLVALKPTLQEIKDIVRSCPKQRFTLVFAPMSPDPSPTAKEGERPEDYLIRAAQGHSLAIAAEAHLTHITPDNLPPAAIHGTYLSAWPAIVESGGLRKMGRSHIHFSTIPPGEGPRGGAVGGVGGVGGGGVVSGIRAGAEVLIWVDVAGSMKEGVDWWVSDNGVVLTDGRRTREMTGDTVGGGEEEEMSGQVDEQAVLGTEWFDRAVVRASGKVLVERGQMVGEVTEEEVKGSKGQQIGKAEKVRGQSKSKRVAGRGEALVTES